LKQGGSAIAGLSVLRLSGPTYAFQTPVTGELIPWLDQPEPNPVPEAIIRQLEWEQLDSWITPADQFFVIKHYNEPSLTAADYSLEVSGLVENPLTLSLAQLKARERQEVTFTMECLGNTGRPTPMVWAVPLRASLTDLFTAIARNQTPDVRALSALESESFRAAPSIGLQRNGERYSWTWERLDQPVERLLWEITRSAVELLTVDDVHRIKECPGANDCGSLFYDASRNGARRWCSMEGCGSRVKMRRHYARHARRTMA